MFVTFIIHDAIGICVKDNPISQLRFIVFLNFLNSFNGLKRMPKTFPVEPKLLIELRLLNFTYKLYFIKIFDSIKVVVGLHNGSSLRFHINFEHQFQQRFELDIMFV